MRHHHFFQAILLVAVLLPSCPTASAFVSTSPPTRRTTTAQCQAKKQCTEESDTIRRSLLFTAFVSALSTTTVPLAANAGEVGARITKAVTTSDLGISVRTSVVKGAQVMDQMDGQWERFSDKYGLGAERSKQSARPSPKVIPEPLPLDTATAKSILETIDDGFLSLLTTVKSTALQERIDRVAALVQPSFQRSGATTTTTTTSLGDWKTLQTAEQFNFACYVHFRAYAEIIQQQGKGFDFNQFRRNFEKETGQRLVALLLATPPPSKQPQRPSQQLLQSKLKQIDQLCQRLKQVGMLSLYEQSPLEEDQILDWLKDESDLSFTLALDGDVTLASQMLLQEQGYYLYPDLARFAVLALLQDLEGQVVQVEDYYFDTGK